MEKLDLQNDMLMPSQMLRLGCAYVLMKSLGVVAGVRSPVVLQEHRR